MTKVTIDETVYSVTVAEENVNVTVADATETVQVQIASGASDIQIISAGDGNSLISSTAGVVTTLKTISAGDNITLGDDGDTITISSTEDDLSNNTTDDLTEGTNNLYYTDARVQTKLGSISGHIIPDTDNAYDLGSDDYKWRSMYLSGGSLYIDGHKVIGSDETGQIDITTDPDQNLNVQAGGTITMLSDGQVTSLQDNTVNLTNSSGRVNVLGILDVGDQIEIDDLNITQIGIEQTQLNQNLTLKTNGDGFVYIETSDFYVGDVNTSAVKIDENSISRYGGGIVTIDGYTNSADMTTAINTAESNANAYTDTRETAITSAYQAYADQSEADAITTSNSYADTAIANLVDSAPATLDTLNELAAALGDDPNFATTVTNSIATKWTQDNTKISNWDAAYSWGDHSIVGYITDYTVTESDVTQHQAALSITESQISDLDHYTDTDARTAISLNSSNLNEFSYDSNTGVFSYTSPTTVSAVGQVVFDVRNASGVAISRGDAVYISGHSGGKILVAKADNDASGKYPAVGLANSAMNNNSDGTVLVSGEMDSLDTSAFAVGDVVYLSDVAGQLTTTRPTGSGNAVQNIGKVARSDSQNGIIIVSGSGRSNDIPNLDSGEVFIGNGGGYVTRALTTDDVSEGSNLYYTDGRVQNWFGTVGLSILNTDVITEGSTNLYYTDGRVNNWFGTSGLPALQATPLTMSQAFTVTGDLSSKNTIVGDSTIGAYDIHGVTINAGDEAWAGISLVETTGGASKPINNFSNPSFSTTVYGGTEAAKTGVESGKRIFSAFALASQDGTTPQFANFRFLSETTEQQSSTARGANFKLETTENGSTATTVSLVVQGDTLTVNQNGNGKITSGGDLVLDDDVIVTGDLDVQGEIKGVIHPFLLGGM